MHAIPLLMVNPDTQNMNYGRNVSNDYLLIKLLFSSVHHNLIPIHIRLYVR